MLRRDFLRQSSLLAAGATASFPLPLAASGRKGKVRIGLIADVHQDIMHDGPARLQAFVDQAKEWQADAVIELGDFCQPKPENRAFADILARFPGPSYHVLGNHDTDGGFTRERVVGFHRMPGRYYSFDLGGIHGVVLDGNDKPPGHKGGYPSHIAEDQIEWLKDDLSKTDHPVFIFSHQSLERPGCIKSQAKVREVIESAKHGDGIRKVAACLNGHWHLDLMRVIQGIPYIHINSASYYWLGSRYRVDRYDGKIHRAHPHLSCTAPYKDSVFTLLEVDFAKRAFMLSARKSEWIGPSPQDLGANPADLNPEWISPGCSARTGSLPY